MFGLFNRGLAYNKLATAFTRLYDGVNAIQYDHETSIGDDDEKLTEELIILAVWARENIFDIMVKQRIDLEENIYIHGHGGWKKIDYYLDKTIGRMIKLAIAAGSEDQIGAILQGGQAYYEAKGYLKGRYKTRPGLT